jgi:hypothetical protein
MCNEENNHEENLIAFEFKAEDDYEIHLNVEVTEEFRNKIQKLQGIATAYILNRYILFGKKGKLFTFAFIESQILNCFPNYKKIEL